MKLRTVFVVLMIMALTACSGSPMTSEPAPSAVEMSTVAEAATTAAEAAETAMTAEAAETAMTAEAATTVEAATTAEATEAVTTFEAFEGFEYDVLIAYTGDVYAIKYVSEGKALIRTSKGEEWIVYYKQKINPENISPEWEIYLDW